MNFINLVCLLAFKGHKTIMLLIIIQSLNKVFVTCIWLFLKCNRENIKLTTPMDLLLAEQLMRRE